MGKFVHVVSVMSKKCILECLLYTAKWDPSNAKCTKREADNARVPPQVYKKQKVVVTKGSKKTTKTEEVFGE